MDLEAKTMSSPSRPVEDWAYTYPHHEEMDRSAPRAWLTNATQLGGHFFPADSTPTTGNKRKIDESPTNSCSKRVCLVRGSGVRTTHLPVDGSIADLLNLGAKLQRKQRRDYQRRYRKKQNERAIMLERTAEVLREQINVLVYQRNILSAQLATYTIWDVATEYFHLFRYGMKLEVGRLLDFLHKTMAINVATNSGHGAVAVKKCWDSLQWFDDVVVSLEDMKKGPCGAVVSTTITRMTISERTLCNVFPALLSGKRNQDWVDNLLDKRVAFSSLTFFEWDHTSGRVSSIITRNNLLTPMLSLLGTIENVSRVFDEALISLDLQCRKSSQAPGVPNSSRLLD